MALNRLIGRRGKVLADRFHAVILRTPTQTRNAIHYLLNNRQHHAPARYPSSWRDPFASSDAPFSVPRTWIMREAAKRQL
jgi:hypothetical protein